VAAVGIGDGTPDFERHRSLRRQDEAEPAVLVRELALPIAFRIEQRDLRETHRREVLLRDPPLEPDAFGQLDHDVTRAGRHVVAPRGEEDPVRSVGSRHVERLRLERVLAGIEPLQPEAAVGGCASRRARERPVGALHACAHERVSELAPRRVDDAPLDREAAAPQPELDLAARFACAELDRGRRAVRARILARPPGRQLESRGGQVREVERAGAARAAPPRRRWRAAPRGPPPPARASFDGAHRGTRAPPADERRRAASRRASPAGRPSARAPRAPPAASGPPRGPGRARARAPPPSPTPASPAVPPASPPVFPDRRSLRP
jgi:hypothetical protein